MKVALGRAVLIKKSGQIGPTNHVTHTLLTTEGKREGAVKESS